MPLTKIESDYLNAQPMKRLTFDGVADLYQNPSHGAVTIARAIELDVAHREYRVKQAAIARDNPALGRPAPVWSEELEIRNEQHIDRHGFGMFGD